MTSIYLSPSVWIRFVNKSSHFKICSNSFKVALLYRYASKSSRQDSFSAKITINGIKNFDSHNMFNYNPGTTLFSSHLEIGFFLHKTCLPEIPPAGTNQVPMVPRLI